MDSLQKINQQQLLEAINEAELPNVQTYKTRDGSELFYRYYQAESNVIMILLHGVSEDSRYLFQLAEFISSNHYAQVYTPDLRGYGEKPIRRGDVDYIGQINDDLEDLIHRLKKDNPECKLILAGHSFGGATTIRYAGYHSADEKIDAYLLLAPYIHPNAPTIKKNTSDGSVKFHLLKFIVLTVLEKLRFRSFHGWKVLTNNKPKEDQHGTETLHLSYRLVLSRLPKMNFQQDIKALNKPTLVLIAGEDELFYADQFAPLFTNNKKVDTVIFPEHNHDGILFSKDVNERLKAWLKTIAMRE